MKNSFKTVIIGISVLTAAVLFSGCDNDSKSSTPMLAENYDGFTSGVLSATTLVRYIDDWKANRPKGVTGRLVIIQAGPSSSGKFIKSNGDDVVVYQIPAAGACDPSYMRHDGVANIPGALLSGTFTDGMINTFHMDPENDYVVFAIGVGSTSIREVIRSYWVLAYWGWSKDRLAFLNGSVDYDFSPSSGLANYLVDAPTTPPSTPSNYSMKTLKTDRTDMQIYLKEMMDIAALEDKSGYFIADARGSDEYHGVVKSKTADKNCGPNHDEQCYSPFQGHIRGAVDFPYTDILIRDDQVEDINGDGVITEADASFRFKSPADLEALYAQKGYRKGDKVIAYCRTGRKSTLITLSAYAVLNYDVAMYDGSWIQWGEMANRTDVNGSEILPAGNRWITDDAKYSVTTGYTDAAYTQSSAPYQIKPDANNSLQVREEDRAYLNL